MKSSNELQIIKHSQRIVYLNKSYSYIISKSDDNISLTLDNGDIIIFSECFPIYQLNGCTNNLTILYNTTQLFVTEIKQMNGNLTLIIKQ